MAVYRSAKSLLRRVSRPKRVKTDAYNYASKGLYSKEYDTLQKIERFGIEAITGRRQFYYYELRQMIVAENIVLSYQSRSLSDNWASWAQKHPEMEKILIEAELLCQNQ